MLMAVRSQDTLYGGAPARIQVNAYPNRGYSGTAIQYMMVPNACMNCPTFNSMIIPQLRTGIIRMFSKKDCTGTFYDFPTASYSYVDIYALAAFVPKTWVLLPDLY
ncbi:hypothetical protein AYI70_g1141 [Smittium culicis]|uniref:Uncharacterized protein n=1 Tax=Smittium culicis TaxID=133412 RepID=A0A1R1YEG9_9FUNG|nr:hypothetical protein AYI70_g1141 [Smittium culicis]